MAKIAIHFNRLPTALSTAEINSYLFYVQQRHDSPSRSFFKFAIYGLRFAYKIEGVEGKSVALPVIKKVKKLPVVLSRHEVRRLFAVPNLLKHKVLLGLLYGCGLRSLEVRNLKLSDLDLDRQMVHVRQGKGRKDRYIPLAQRVVDLLHEYIFLEKPDIWLFNGRPEGRAGGDFDSRYSQRGVLWAVKHAAQMAGIIKNISPHTLRHTFATHLLEDGLDIISIKDLLGHERVETTLVYLHVARFDKMRSYSPIDTLYNDEYKVPIAAPAPCVLLQKVQGCSDCRSVLENIQFN